MIGDCKGDAYMNYMNGNVCMRPLQVDKECVGAPSLSSTRGSSSSGSKGSRFQHVDLSHKWWMMILLICLSGGGELPRPLALSVSTHTVDVWRLPELQGPMRAD